MSHWLILKLQFLFIVFGIYVVLTAEGGYVGCYEYSAATQFKKFELKENNGNTCTRACFPGSRYAGTEVCHFYFIYLYVLFNDSEY